MSDLLLLFQPYSVTAHWTVQTRNARQSLECSLPGLAVPSPSEPRETNSNTDRRLLYIFEHRKLLGYWTGAHHILPDVLVSSLLLTRLSALQYSSPFRKASAMNEGEVGQFRCLPIYNPLKSAEP